MSNKLNVENLSTININAKIVKFNSHVNERQKAINMPICKGILYGLGTDFDEVPYVNPALNGNVAITSTRFNFKLDMVIVSTLLFMKSYRD